jgi:hypothetical protein
MERPMLSRVLTISARLPQVVAATPPLLAVTTLPLPPVVTRHLPLLATTLSLLSPRPLNPLSLRLLLLVLVTALTVRLNCPEVVSLSQSLSLPLLNLPPHRLPRLLRLPLPPRPPRLPATALVRRDPALTLDPAPAKATKVATLDPVAVDSLLELPAHQRESGTALVARLSSAVPVVLGLPPNNFHLALAALLAKVLILA